jgi:hypothetical protein
MDCHLITIKIGVEGGANQGVELKSIAVDQHGFEGLDAKSV